MPVREMKTKEEIAVRDVKVLKVYNLINNNGAKLWLRLGVMQGNMNALCASGDKGYRWSFVGDDIPMPVRSRTWFNGFPEATMLDWLKGNGWNVQSVADMHNGNVRVFEASKGNENPDGLSDAMLERSGENALNYAVRLMWKNSARIKALALYRYIKRCDLLEANEAVQAIVDEQP